MTIEQYRAAFIVHPAMILMVIAVFCRVACVSVLLSRRMGSKYPGLLIYLAGGTLRGAALLAFGYAKPGGYVETWQSTWWVPLFCNSILAADCVRLMALHFRNIRGFALRLAATGCIIGLMFAGLTARWGTPVWEAWQAKPVESARDMIAILMVALWVCRRWFFSSPITTIRQNVHRLVNGAIGVFGINWVAELVSRVTQLQFQDQINLLIASIPIVATYAWLKIDRRGEEWIPPPPASDREMDAADEELSALARRIRAAASGR